MQLILYSPKLQFNDSFPKSLLGTYLPLSTNLSQKKLKLREIFIVFLGYNNHLSNYKECPFEMRKHLNCTIRDFPLNLYFLATHIIVQIDLSTTSAWKPESRGLVILQRTPAQRISSGITRPHTINSDGTAVCCINSAGRPQARQCTASFHLQTSLHNSATSPQSVNKPSGRPFSRSLIRKWTRGPALIGKTRQCNCPYCCRVLICLKSPREAPICASARAIRSVKRWHLFVIPLHKIKF